MQLDLTDEEGAALLRELNNIIESDSLSVVSAHPGAAHHPSEVAGCAIGTAAGESADSRRAKSGASATRWPAAAVRRTRAVDCRPSLDDFSCRWASKADWLLSGPATFIIS
jgi:hypothetical protein